MEFVMPLGDSIANMHLDKTIKGAFTGEVITKEGYVLRAEIPELNGRKV